MKANIGKAEIAVPAGWGGMGRDDRREGIAAALENMARAVREDRADMRPMRDSNGNTRRVRVAV